MDSFKENHLRLRLHSSVDGSSLELAQDESKCPTQFLHWSLDALTWRTLWLEQNYSKLKNYIEICIEQNIQAMLTSGGGLDSPKEDTNTATLRYIFSSVHLTRVFYLYSSTLYGLLCLTFDLFCLTLSFIFLNPCTFLYYLT